NAAPTSTRASWNSPAASSACDDSARHSETISYKSVVMAFALVAVVSALKTGDLAFREARTGVLQQSQDSVIQQFRVCQRRRRLHAISTRW
ncbi:hypothetical protein ACFZAU_37160, partial [Streptomyces sp. NPDC008238]